MNGKRFTSLENTGSFIKKENAEGAKSLLLQNTQVKEKDIVSIVKIVSKNQHNFYYFYLCFDM